MTHVLLITHGNLGKVLLEVATKMIGERPEFQALSFDGDADGFGRSLNQIMDSFAVKDQILILTDLFGGTPSNLAIPHLTKGRVEVLTGLNLAILLHLLAQPGQKPFAELCLGAKKAGLESVLVAGEFL